MPDIKISEAVFKKITFNRKTLLFKKAIEISKMILLQYHPDVNKGKNHVLALMFDMNKLWEQFVYISLKNHKHKTYSITAQTSKNFWKSNDGRKTTLRPDIVISKADNEFLVLDTKWKNINGYNPTPEDLRQLYVYHYYFNAKKVALVYPGNAENRNGLFFEPNDKLSDKICSIITLEVNKDIKTWQEQIFNKIENWAAEVFK